MKKIDLPTHLPQKLTGMYDREKKKIQCNKINQNSPILPSPPSLPRLTNGNHKLVRQSKKAKTGYVESKAHITHKEYPEKKATCSSFA